MTTKKIRELKVEDALLYLDMVKTEFGSKPQIYNEFLEIMKSFKSQEIDTPGVISCVSNLFRGNAKLILGFNTFLPDGYKIEIPYEQVSKEGGEERRAQWVTMRHPGGGRTIVVHPEQYETTPQEKELAQVPTAAPKPDPVSNKEVRALKSATSAGLDPQDRGAKTASKDKLGVPRPSVIKPDPGARSDAMGKTGRMIPMSSSGRKEMSARAKHPVEFDHAIYYVTTVKRRFSNQPETYKSFLEILHTYQKEQRSIKEVLDRVSELFSEHPDLLKEFTYFLPDAVQEQAKERLQRAAREAELRQARQGGKSRRRPAGPARRTPGSSSSPSERLQRDRQGVGGPSANSDSSRLEGPGGDGVSAGDGLNEDLYDEGQRKAHVAHIRRQRSEAARKQASVLFSKESDLLKRIKKVLVASNRGPALWHDFVKCLNLFSRQVFDRQDMLRLSNDILGGEPDMLNEFRALLGPVTAAKADEVLNPFSTLPLGEINFSNCAVATPSYRSLPENYPKQISSGRTELEDSVLNDEWVSLPVGSEENYSFKHMRKNQYEEALFKCEDDLFEVDMIIGATKNTIAVLEQLLLSLREVEEKAAKAAHKLFPGFGGQPDAKPRSDDPVVRAIDAARRSWRPDGQMLRSFHIAAISCVYGEQATEVLNALKSRPSAALPVILWRLRQKNAEWLAAQNSAKGQWKDVMDQNFAKSLDHRSFYFRQTEKRVLSVRHIVSEVKERKEAIEVALATLMNKKKKIDREHPVEPIEAAPVPEKPEDNESPGEKEASEDTAMRAMKAAAPLLFSTTSMEGPKYRDLCLCDEEEEPASFSPHQVFRHEETAVQKDAFLILQHAVDCSSHSTADRAKMHHVWRHALSLFYHMPMDVVYHGRAISKGPLDRSSAPPKRYHLDESLNMLGLVNTSKLEFDSMYQRYIYPTGSDVLTLFGAARILGTRPCTGREPFLYEVKLSFGQATIAPSAILRSLTPDAFHWAAEAADIAYDDEMSAAEAMVGAEGKSRRDTKVSGNESQDLARSTGEGPEIFMGTQSTLAFFSLFALLCDRLSTARRLAKLQEEEAPQAPVAHPLKIRALDLQANFTINHEDSARDTPRADSARQPVAIMATISAEQLNLQVPEGWNTTPNDTPRGGKTPQKEARDSWDTSLSPLDLEAPRGSMLSPSYGSRRSRSSRPWNKYHAYWLELVKMLANDVDPTDYEDKVRKLLGNRSYPLYTMDKLCNTLVKQLHTLATDEASSSLCDLYVSEALRSRASGNVNIEAYKRRAAAVVASVKARPEDLYCFKYFPGLCFRQELWRSEDDTSCFTFIPEHRRRPDHIDAGMPAMDKLRTPLTFAPEASSTALLLVQFLGPIAHGRSTNAGGSADNMTTLALAAGAEDDDQQISSEAEDNMTVASEVTSFEERPRTRGTSSPSPSQGTPTPSDGDHAFSPEDDDYPEEMMDATVEEKEKLLMESLVEDGEDAAARFSVNDTDVETDLQKTMILEPRSSKTGKGFTHSEATKSSDDSSTVGSKRPVRGGRMGVRKRRRH